MFTTWSAWEITQSGTVSRTVTPSVCWITSFSDSRCCTFTAQITLIPASMSASTSSQRFRNLEPGTFVCASSSTSATVGRRASTASTSISRSVTPRYSIARVGTLSSPSSNAAVSARPWVSMKPTTTSTPRCRSACASVSMRYVLPTPAAEPMYTLSFPRSRRLTSLRNSALSPLSGRSMPEAIMALRARRPGGAGQCIGAAFPHDRRRERHDPRGR